MKESEFKNLYDKYFDSIRRYIYYRSSDEALATDVAQNCFLKLWEKKDFLYKKNIKALLYKMATDEFINHWRKQKREREFANEHFEIKSNVFCSIQSGSFKSDDLETGNSTLNTIDVTFDDVKNTIRAEEKFKEQKGGVDLTAADLIVSVGRGIAKEENIPMAEELTTLLNAEMGSSRPIVDYGWLPHDRQIGSSGQVVSPKLYFSLGVSGAIQHQVGMKGSDKIMAINKDENAPIFEISDYSVVGDLLEIVPKLIDRIKEN